MLEKKPNMTNTMMTLDGGEVAVAVDAEIEDGLGGGQLAHEEAGERQRRR